MAFTPAHGLWMGASPERLVKEEQDHVRVDAIAATRPSDDIPTKISAWGAKELDEQGQVAHYLHAAFARMDLRNITVRGPEVVKAGPVAHLHTTLEADLGDALLGDLVVELHPTPAIGGVPKEEALCFIAGHERHKRALYTGFWIFAIFIKAALLIYCAVETLPGSGGHKGKCLGAGLAAFAVSCALGRLMTVGQHSPLITVVPFVVFSSLIPLVWLLGHRKARGTNETNH